MKFVIPVTFTVEIANVDETKFSRDKIEKLIRAHVAHIVSDREGHAEMAIVLCGNLGLENMDDVKPTVALR